MKFGVQPPPVEQDPVYNQPCYTVCEIARVCSVCICKSGAARRVLTHHCVTSYCSELLLFRAAAQEPPVSRMCRTRGDCSGRIIPD